MLKLGLNESILQNIAELTSIKGSKYISIVTYDEYLIFYSETSEYFKLYPIHVGNCEKINYHVPVETLGLVLGMGTLVIENKGNILCISRQIQTNTGTFSVVSVEIAREIDINYEHISKVIEDYKEKSKISFKDLSSIKLLYNLTRLSSKRGKSEGPAGVAVSNGYGYVVGQGYRAFYKINESAPMLFTNECIEELNKFVKPLDELSIFVSAGYNVCENGDIFFGWRRVRNQVPLEVEDYESKVPLAKYQFNMVSLVEALERISENKMSRIKLSIDFPHALIKLENNDSICKIACYCTFIEGQKVEPINLDFSLCKSLLCTSLTAGQITLKIYESFIALELKTGIHLILARSD